MEAAAAEKARREKEAADAEEKARREKEVADAEEKARREKEAADAEEKARFDEWEEPPIPQDQSVSLRRSLRSFCAPVPDLNSLN